ncbi:MAG: hypothetical protein J5990_03265 [Bacteroidales bacterium]|nr:hypothetical protein [Bacteroidales bacterium]
MDGMNRHIYRLVAAVLAAITIVSCNDAMRSETFRVLEDVDSYIEARPDSALAVLEGINKSELTSKELEAKYALLLSQALDKNYIDLQSDSIIAPAVRYYENHGTPDERLLTHYYRGVIYLNDGDRESAMESYIKAERYVDECRDYGVIARLYTAKMNLYQYAYDFASALEQEEIASSYFLKDKDTIRYISTLNTITGLKMQLGQYSEAYQYLDKIKSLWNNLDEYQKSIYYSNMLHLSKSDSVLNTGSILKEYVSEISNHQYADWLNIANAYISVSDYQSASDAIDRYIEYGGIANAPYYWTLALLYEGLKEYEKSNSAYKEYFKITGEENVVILESDTKFIEERHKKEIELIDAEHSKERITLISIIAILCAVIIIYLIRKQLQIRTAEKKQLEIEKKRYEQLYADAIAERDALTKMIEDSSVKDETKAVIRERLEVLNKVIISHITDTSSANKKAYQELEALVADKESFIESTRLTIEGNNPEFIAALKKQGLTDEEINICCLYVIGLKGKDIKAYTSQPRLYIQSAEIRHKLGLTENDTNLAIHLRNMLEKEVC